MSCAHIPEDRGPSGGLPMPVDPSSPNGAERAAVCARMCKPSRRSRRIAAALILSAALAIQVSPPAYAQVANPVYVDDSPAAGDTFLRVRDHLATGNLNEAVRALQSLLDEMPDRLVGVGLARGMVDRAAPVAAGAGISTGTDSRDLFRSVRAEANSVLLSAPELLARYRQLQEPVASVRLQEGDVDGVERSCLLTSAGFEAALRVAQSQIEDARFHAAFLTLDQLRDHPDRTGERASDAARLAGLLVRYLDEPAVHALYSAWSSEPAGEMVAWPAIARTAGRSPLDTGDRADLDAYLGKPLRSVAVSEDKMVPTMLRALSGVESERLPAAARHLLILPTVADDTLYLNDGVQVTAWDRITLAPKWIVRGDVPAGEDPAQAAMNLRSALRGNPTPEDPTTVTVSGRTAVATLGLALSGIRWPDARIIAIDTLTGNLRWAMGVDELDPALAAQSVRGPAVIAEGTVVVALRAALPDRRMVTLYLAGIDVASGKLRWSRLIGSIGVLPYRQDPYVSEAAALEGGIVYHSDMLGVVSATEAETGRPVWVRRLPTVPAQSWDALHPWQMGRPIVAGDSLIILSPDRRLIVRLDRATGELRGSIAASEFDRMPARYLVRAGDTLGVVFDNRIGLAPLDSFERAKPQASVRVADPGFNGRVSAVGHRLLGPVGAGLLVYDTTKPDAEPTLLPLDSPGNALALESQLLVVDDFTVHTYLRWDVAEQLLARRMLDDPSDPTSAATLAELAYRAGRHDRILVAVDAALGALANRPPSETSEPTRARLFASLQAMVSDALEQPRAVTAPDMPAETGPARIEDNSLLGELVERLRRAARTPDERLGYMLSKGRLHERVGEPVLAMDAYQATLDSDELAGATWAGPRLSTRGELEVTRRMVALVQAKGPGIYAAHDADALEAAAKLPPEPKPDQIVRLAVRFPVSSIASSLWEQAAASYKRAGRDHAVVGAMESALEAAERVPGGADIGAVAGRLLTELESRQQYAAAGNALKNILERHPGLQITVNGAPLEPAALASRLAELVAARQRWPRLGDLRSEGVQVLAGWSIMEPIMRLRTGVSPRGVMLRSSEKLALFTPVDPGPEDATGAGQLVAAWERPIETEMAELIRIDSEAAYIFYASAKGAVIEKASQSPPGLKWQTPLFADVPGRSGAPRNNRRDRDEPIQTPQDGMSMLTDGVITMDDRTMVLLERQGYATAIDTQSGAVLWTIRTPLDRVYDAAIAGGSLVVGGDQEVRGAPGERVGALRPEIAVLDARTGQEVQRLPQRWGGVRWVRMTDSGQLVAGCENAIVCTDLTRGQVNWVLSDPHLSVSRDAWIFHNALFVLDRDRRLWWADVQTGRVSPDSLEAPRGRLDGVRRIDAALIPPAQGAANSRPVVAFTTHQGVLLYDLDGTFRGVDAVGGLDGVLPAVPSQDRLITVTTMPEGRRGDREMLYTIHVMETGSAMVRESVPIVLGVPPRTQAVMDGRFLITSGGTTLSIPAPAPK